MKRPTRAALATATAAALTGGLLTLATAAPASAAAAKYADDFNGDGHRDYAVYSYGPAGDSKGGGVLVTFGTANGPGTKSQFIDQASPGVPGADETDDFFGEVRTAADFNNDGYGDLAVTATGEDVDGRKDEGAVTVLWGSEDGLSGGLTIPNKGPRESYARMGSDLATGDFNGDGKADLALVNAAKTYVYRGSISKSGVHGTVSTLDKESSSFSSTAVIAGKVDKDGKTDLVIIGDVVTGTYIASDAWFIKGGEVKLYPGNTLRLERVDGNGGMADRGGDGVINDFNKDGFGDIAIGTPLYDKWKGRVSVWYGSSSGPDKSARFTQSTSGIAGTPEADDSFGDSISSGDINGDGYRDLAIGVPGEALGGREWAGGVEVLYGRASGLSATGSQWFARDTTGVPGDLQSDDSFGNAVRLRDTNRDGKADLYVQGAYGSLVLRGSSTGVTTSGATAVEGETVEGMLQ
ncbi:FG-GAP and VCBS repeat-containing protein [Streptomyces bluensis]|uniref:FG-GAP and VCBS repeat-containing protein n=1 Tax=Streptomyces bluensis TaxID=33897 RepID=A0ABW6UA17_9ACTN